MGQKFAFTCRGKEFTFDNRDDYLKAFSNYLIVDGRREHGREITEEMLLAPETQDYYNTYLTETEKQANITE